ncbi:MAG: pilus assembly protein [Planctomycetaceae bacterium]
MHSRFAMQSRRTENHLRHRTRRDGVLSMELVLTLPIVMVLLMGILEFTMLFFAQGSVREASRLGARRATMQGVGEEDIHQDIKHALGRTLYPYAEVSLTDAEHSGDPVIVAVRVPMRAASPNLLWPIGFDLNGRYLTSQSHMVKE